MPTNYNPLIFVEHLSPPSNIFSITNSGEQSLPILIIDTPHAECRPWSSERHWCDKIVGKIIRPLHKELSRSFNVITLQNHIPRWSFDANRKHARKEPYRKKLAALLSWYKPWAFIDLHSFWEHDPNWKDYDIVLLIYDDHPMPEFLYDLRLALQQEGLAVEIVQNERCVDIIRTNASSTPRCTLLEINERWLGRERELATKAARAINTVRRNSLSAVHPIWLQRTKDLHPISGIDTTQPLSEHLRKYGMTLIGMGPSEPTEDERKELISFCYQCIDVIREKGATSLWEVPSTDRPLLLWLKLDDYLYTINDFKNIIRLLEDEELSSSHPAIHPSMKMKNLPPEQSDHQVRLVFDNIDKLLGSMNPPYSVRIIAEGELSLTHKGEEIPILCATCNKPITGWDNWYEMKEKDAAPRTTCKHCGSHSIAIERRHITAIHPKHQIPSSKTEHICTECGESFTIDDYKNAVQYELKHVVICSYVDHGPICPQCIYDQCPECGKFVCSTCHSKGETAYVGTCDDCHALYGMWCCGEKHMKWCDTCIHWFCKACYPKHSCHFMRRHFMRPSNP